VPKFSLSRVSKFWKYDSIKLLFSSLSGIYTLHYAAEAPATAEFEPWQQ
jgi:hypothetical protein